MNIPSDWLPTAANINALPEPIRRYIHDLETRTDPAGDVRRIAELKAAASGVEAMYIAARDELNAVNRLLSSTWRVKDYSDGWIECTAADALAAIKHMGGAYIKPLEARNEREG